MARKQLKAAPLEGEYIPPGQPDSFGRLTLDRTRAYVDKLNGMTEKEATELMNKGIQVKLMLLNDQILKQLEVLDTSTDPRERLQAISIIEKLTVAVSMITENKIKLDRALGVGLGNVLPPPPAVAHEVTEDEFMSTYAADRKMLTDGSLAIPEILGQPPKA